MQNTCFKCGSFLPETAFRCYECKTPVSRLQSSDSATQTFKKVRTIVILVVALFAGLMIYKMFIGTNPETKQISKAESLSNSSNQAANFNYQTAAQNLFKDENEKFAKEKEKRQQTIAERDSWKSNNFKDYKPNCQTTGYTQDQWGSHPVVQCR